MRREEVAEMPTMEQCRQCVAEAGKEWNSSSESDLQEGLCPQKAEDEEYECERYEGPIQAIGRIRLI